MNFSIIIATYNRKKSFLDCMRLLSSESANYDCQVIIILNGDSLYQDKYKSLFPNFEFIYTPLVNMSEAKNIGLSRSKSEYVLFLDDDSLLSEGYFDQVNFESNWDVLSGPELTCPQDNLKLKPLYWSLASTLCMGPSSDSHSKTCNFDGNASVDLISFGNFWIKRSPLEKTVFNQKIYKNEIYYFLLSLKDKKHTFHFDPKLYVYRSNDFQFEKLAKALSRANQCRILTFFKEPKPSGLIYFMPLIFNLIVFRTISHFNTISVLLFFSYSIGVLIYGVFKHFTLSFKFLFYHYFILLSYSVGTLSAFTEQCLQFYNKFRENNSLIKESKTK